MALSIGKPALMSTPTRPVNDLRAVGEALFGPSWQTPLADSLGVSDRTVRRWLAGQAGIPGGVWAEIGAICNSRGEHLKWLAANIHNGPD